MIQIREATEDDVAAISEVFHACYGDDYTFPEFYNETFLKKLVFSDDTLGLVAEDTDSGRVLGTASVVLEIGALTDLVGEFGRLAVHPDGRGEGLGNLLMKGRLERVSDRLHVGLVDGRVATRQDVVGGVPAATRGPHPVFLCRVPRTLPKTRQCAV